LSAIATPQLASPDPLDARLPHRRPAHSASSSTVFGGFPRAAWQKPRVF
jgi:hypothetical protein